MLGNGKGLFGSNPMASDPMQPMTKPREGPSRTQGILGVIGDMLSTGGGGQANYMQNVMQQRQMEQMQGYRTQQAKVAQDADQQQWLARQAYERANPAPQAPHYWETNNGSLAAIGPDGQPRVMYQDPDPAPNPNDEWIHFEFGDGRMYNGPRSGLQQAIGAPTPSGGASPPPRPVGGLVPMGGAGGNASGGF